MYFGGGFKCVGKFDLVVCSGGFNRLGIHLDIMDSLYNVMERMRGLYVSWGF